MRPTLFRKARQRHKKAVREASNEQVDVDIGLVKEVTKRDVSIASAHQEYEEMRESHYLPTKSPGFDTKREKLSHDQTTDEPSDLVDALKRRTKPKAKDFLPIAMPRPDPPSEHGYEQDHQHHSEQDDYRSEFDAPEHIELHEIDSNDDDERTEVSDLTHITTGRTTYGKHRVITSHPRSPTNRGYTFSGTSLERVSEEDSQRLSVGQKPYIEVDVTDLDNIHDAVHEATKDLKKPDTLAPEDRYGLPYEDTDYRDDDASDDSWGEAIVGSHILEARVRQDSSGQEPMVGEGNSAPTMGPPTPRSDIAHLVKETFSAEGEVIIDISEIEDEHFDSVEVRRKSPRAKSKPKATPDMQYRPLDAVEMDRQSPRKRQHGYKVEMPQRNRELSTSPRRKEDSKPKLVQPDSVDTKGGDDGEGQQHSADFFQSPLGYLRQAASNISSQLQRVELISEQDLDGMLGVLGKDVKETSENIPEQQEVVNLMGEQFKTTANDIDQTVREGSKDLTLQTESLEEMVETVKTTYQKNIVNCGVNTATVVPEQPPALAPEPQTFMVPLALQANLYEQECTRMRDTVDGTAPSDALETGDSIGNTELVASVSPEGPSETQTNEASEQEDGKPSNEDETKLSEQLLSEDHQDAQVEETPSGQEQDNL